MRPSCYELHAETVSAGIQPAIGKLIPPKPAPPWLPGEIEALGYDALALDMEAALGVSSLPLPKLRRQRSDDLTSQANGLQPSAAVCESR